MKKILITYATYGGGHLSAAKAIKNYIDENYEDVETKLVDCMMYINKVVNGVSTRIYNKITTNTPWLWKRVYFNSKKGILSKISNGSNKLMSKKLVKLFDEFKPDIVISTHMFSTQMIGYLKRKGKVNCTLATVLTDFAPHDQWLEEHEYGNFFFVSNENMRQALIEEFHVNSNIVYTTGIPISPVFSKEFNKEKIYADLGFTPNKKTILLFAGREFGAARKKVLEVFNALIKHLDTCQIVAVAGKNKKMESEFHKIADNLQNTSGLKIFNYLTNVPEIMSISSLVITKSGGLTSSESLASALPVLVINPIPGQEEENAEFLVNAGVAEWLKKKDNAEEIINNLLNSPEKLKEMSNNARNLAHLDSTKNICDTILNSTK